MGLGPGARRPEGFKLSPASYQLGNPRQATSHLKISSVGSGFLKELGWRPRGCRRDASVQKQNWKCVLPAGCQDYRGSYTMLDISILSCQINLCLPGLSSILISKVDHHRVSGTILAHSFQSGAPESHQPLCTVLLWLLSFRCSRVQVGGMVLILWKTPRERRFGNSHFTGMNQRRVIQLLGCFK